VAVTDPEAEQARLVAELRAANARIAEVELSNRRLRSQLRTARNSEERLQGEVRAMRRSLSWRITYPVRAFMRLVTPRKF
jgi:chromosome segregation ATPase